MSAAPIARPMVALLPTTDIQTPPIDVVAAFAVVPPSKTYEHIIRDAAAEYNVDAALLRAIVEAESQFDPSVVSKAGAEGLMQLMPELADALGVADSFDPRDNIMGGARYLKGLLEQYDGDLDKTLAGYNAGPGNVERYGGVPPFEETRKYVKNIKRLMLEAKRRSAAD
jgi:soluble lytic murein transglycosylase-like protein